MLSGLNILNLIIAYTGIIILTEVSWWIFALAGTIALGLAIVTVTWQSWRAATRNPVEALRYE